MMFARKVEASYSLLIDTQLFTIFDRTAIFKNIAREISNIQTLEKCKIISLFRIWHELD